MLFEGKVVLITGAAMGIGKAIAEAFAAEGASLVLGDVVFRNVREKLYEYYKSNPK